MKYLFLAFLLPLFPQSASADSAFYMGAGFGGIVFDGDALTAGGYGLSLIGGYKFNQTFSFEIDYHDFGDVEDDPAETRAAFRSPPP